MQKGRDLMLNMAQLSGNPLAVFDKFKDNIFSTLHVGTIAVVTAIDSDTGLLTVKPIINQRIVNSDGTTKWQEYAEIPDTPYCSSYSSPAVGDSVLIMYLDHDISAWIDYLGNDSSGAPAAQNQQIVRSHNIADAVVIDKLMSSSSAVSPQNYVTITGSKDDDGSGVSTALIEFLESWEGLRLDWYDDGYGNQTIGYGHTGDLPSGYTVPLTNETALSLLKYDLTSRITYTKELFAGYTLKQCQFDALVDLVFNVGSLGSGMISTVKSGTTDYSTMQTAFAAYAHPSSLASRRAAEAAMYVYGTYSGNG
jgi:GH24 family phage-related lysozyme (muramidase)